MFTNIPTLQHTGIHQLLHCEHKVFRWLIIHEFVVVHHWINYICVMISINLLRTIQVRIKNSLYLCLLIVFAIQPQYHCFQE